MYNSINLFAFDLVLCTHDNCLVVLLAQDHIFSLFKIHQLRGTIIKCNVLNFKNGLAFARRRIIRLVCVILGPAHTTSWIISSFSFGLLLA